MSQVAVSQPESTQNPTVLLTTPVPLTQSANNKKEVATVKQSSVLSPGKLVSRLFLLHKKFK